MYSATNLYQPTDVTKHRTVHTAYTTRTELRVDVHGK